MKFSFRVTAIGLILAGLMLRASFWQYDRYIEKKKLLAGYALNSSSEPIDLPVQNGEKSLGEFLYRKVGLEGEYDFSQQFLISNRKDRSGPGFWILTPFKIADTDKTIIVSRGFIPFADREPEKWTKYNREPRENLIAVVQESVEQKYAIVPAKSSALEGRIWLYPDIAQISEHLDYPIITSVFLQRLVQEGDPEFPKESISLRVPPSTHFGYTIEWALLAVLCLSITAAIQLSPGLRSRFAGKKFRRKPQS
jgi:surfeit locus 1 family protein